MQGQTTHGDFPPPVRPPNRVKQPLGLGGQFKLVYHTRKGTRDYGQTVLIVYVRVLTNNGLK